MNTPAEDPGTCRWLWGTYGDRYGCIQVYLRACLEAFGLRGSLVPPALSYKLTQRNHFMFWVLWRSMWNDQTAQLTLHVVKGDGPALFGRDWDMRVGDVVSTAPRLACICRTNPTTDWKRPSSAPVVQFLKQGWPTTMDKDSLLVPFFKRSSELSLFEGCVLWRSCVIVPSVYWEAILAELHEGTLA